MTKLSCLNEFLAENTMEDVFSLPSLQLLSEKSRSIELNWIRLSRIHWFLGNSLSRLLAQRVFQLNTQSSKLFYIKLNYYKCSCQSLYPAINIFLLTGNWKLYICVETVLSCPSNWWKHWSLWQLVNNITQSKQSRWGNISFIGAGANVMPPAGAGVSEANILYLR